MKIVQKIWIQNEVLKKRNAKLYLTIKITLIHSSEGAEPVLIDCVVNLSKRSLQQLRYVKKERIFISEDTEFFIFAALR